MTIFIHIMTFGILILGFVIAWYCKQYYALLKKARIEQATQPVPDAGEMQFIESPDCITENGIHSIVNSNDPIFSSECENCFERYVLVSETVLQKSGVIIKPKIKPHKKE